MRIPRIYQDSVLSTGSTIDLDERASKHLIQVLRFDTGRELILFNGLGGEYRASLNKLSKRSASADIFEKLELNCENPVDIHLAQCVSKGDRFEFAIQKSVELGVTEITPIFSTRSQLKLNTERKDKKMLHWQQIALSACEQSGRTSIVQIHEPISLPDFLAEQSNSTATKIILHPESNTKLSSLALTGNYTLLIGPEGGFENAEIELAIAKDFKGIQLGQQILRTETAPIASMAAIYALEKVY